jgi:molybdate transport system permease protein
MSFGPLTSDETQALALSLWVSSIAVLVSLPLGVASGWVLARKQFLGKTIVETLVNLPLVIPPVVTGYLLLVLFGRGGPLGHWLYQWLGLEFVFNWKGAALASAVMAFPLMVRSIRQAIAAVDPKLEQAARSLGASPLDVLWSVTLPLARNGLIAGCILAFARSLGEFGATIMIAGNIPGETRTIPLEIYTVLEAPGGEQRGLRLVIISIMIAFVAVAVSEWLERRGKTHL